MWVSGVTVEGLLVVWHALPRRTQKDLRVQFSGKNPDFTLLFRWWEFMGFLFDRASLGNERGSRPKEINSQWFPSVTSSSTPADELIASCNAHVLLNSGCIHHGTVVSVDLFVILGRSRHICPRTEKHYHLHCLEALSSCAWLVWTTCVINSFYFFTY